jgi:tRNA(Ile)-lysidine synthase
MPVVRDLGPGLLLRPLLAISRDELSDWARKNAVSWCEDSSNQNEQFARNYLRHRILPLLRERWPAAAGSAARSAALCAEADSVLQEIAEQDLGMPLAEGAYATAVLPIERFTGLSGGRVRNLLRFWIRIQGQPVPGHDLLTEIVDSVIPARADAEPVVRWKDSELRRYRDKLYLMQPLAEAPDQVLDWDTDHPLVLPGSLGRLELAAAEQGRHGDVIASRLLERQCLVRFRAGGEQFRPAGGRQKPLKKWLQETGIPPWMRSRLPLVFCADRLVWVPGIGCAEELLARAGEEGRIIRWHRGSEVNS